ncbi:hypothetical protein UA08_03496 [Talaromyces atroroseus]|uniref:Heat shock factor-binding protein 1 n=1 Tax=Talaromyces atroroseus TaxID=1441469 RepID=A0A225AJ11_TALAT|nr:hypothetical protein UA08_03496 [Talaromyces atroroseus]OKL61472.1 hypothetical protein UA08_03496 [Talaromyces atroroseus]
MSTDIKDSSPGGDAESQLLKPQSASESSTELAAAVDDLLDQLQHKFDGVSSEIFGKPILVDDMSRRLDELEASLSTAQEEAGVTKS